MPIKALMPELVPLVHHIELAKAGWRERLAEQLFVAAARSLSQPAVSVETLRKFVMDTYGLRLSDADSKRAVGALRSKKLFIEIENGGYKVSEAHGEELSRQMVAAASLEQSAREEFETIIGRHGLEITDAWTAFNDRCLRPLVGEVGARIYHVLSGEAPASWQQRHVDAYAGRYPAEQQAPIASAVDEFVRSAPSGRKFILQLLHAHLLMSAGSLPEPTLARLQNQLRATTQLTLVVDTNVLFSLLDLHENPGNAPSRDLQSLAVSLKGKVNVKMVVLPITLDEAKRTLIYYKQKLSRLHVTALLGRSALRYENELSGITQRFLQAAANGKARLDAETYFEPYLDDLLAIVRDKGIDLYNENTTSLSTRQDVVDDILAQEERASAKGGDGKRYEMIEHDVVLWHCVQDRRPIASTALLDASHWVVTLDYQLLGFDAYKHRGQASYAPVCVHPTVLIQLLQLWLPRSVDLDEAMVNSLRPMLPHEFDPDAEEVTVRILSSLSRYENVDNLGDETVAQILMNQALRQRMKSERDVERQTQLVKEALIESAEEAKRALQAAAEERSRLAASLKEKEARQAELLANLEATKAQAARHADVAGTVTAQAERLGTRVQELETELHRASSRSDIAHQQAQELAFWFRASMVMLAGLVGSGLLFWGFTEETTVGTPQVGIGLLLVWLVCWVEQTGWSGYRSGFMMKSPVFAKLYRWRRAAWALAGAIAVGAMGNRFDAYLRALGW